MTLYNRAFYSEYHVGSLAAATRILGLVAPALNCRRVLDVGCGTGAWLQAARAVFGLDSSHVVGIDASRTKAFHDPQAAEYIYQDLEDPLRVEGTFDLAICMEVAEHVSEGRADALVQELAARADAVLFAAAIPGQGGTGHINEQWADYWFTKFSAQGFVAIDAVRPRVWRDGEIAAWYAQNTFLYARHPSRLRGVLGSDIIASPDDWRLSLVHPGVFTLAGCETAGAGRLLKALPGRLVSALKRRARL